MKRASPEATEGGRSQASTLALSAAWPFVSGSRYETFLWSLNKQGPAVLRKLVRNVVFTAAWARPLLARN